MIAETRASNISGTGLIKRHGVIIDHLNIHHRDSQA